MTPQSGPSWLALAWLTVVLPFASLPWLTIAHDQDEVDAWWQSHLFFHIAYLPFVRAAVYVTRALAGAAPSRALRRLAAFVACLQVLAVVGHAGELLAVVRHGGLDAGEAIYQETAHEMFGVATPMMLLLSVALIVAITMGQAVVRRSYHGDPG